MDSYTYFYKLGCHNDPLDIHCQAYNMFLQPCNKNMFLVMHEWLSGELTFCLFPAAYQPFVSDFTQCYLSTPETDDHNPLTTTLGANAATPRTGHVPLLREWAKATLAGLTPRFAENRITLSCVAFRLPRVCGTSAWLPCGYYSLWAAVN